MAKKKILGKSKLSDREQKTIEDKSDDLKLIPEKEKFYPRSYRLRGTDLSNLRKIIKEVNDTKITVKGLTETDIIRTLIHIGAKTKPEKLIKAYKETIFI